MGEYINIYKDYNKHRFKPKTVVTTQDREPEKNTGGLLGGIGYTAGKLGLGVAGVGEGVLDTGAAIFDVLRGDLDSAKDRYKENVTGDLSRDLEEWYNPNGVMRFVGDTASGIGQSSVFLLDAVAPGLGTTLFFAGVLGQNVASAAEQTGEVGLRELGYGAASAGLEAVIGKAIGAGGQATKQLGGAILKSTGKTAAKKAAQTTGKGAIKNLLIEVGKSAAGEGVEEGVSEVADTWLLQWFGIDEDAETSIGQVLYAAGVGAVSGGLMTAGPAAINYNQTVKAGRAVKEAGEVDILLQRAKNAVAGATRAENRAKGEVIKGSDKYDKDANVFSRAASWNKATFGVNRRAKQESRQARQIRETLEKNIKGYEQLSEAVRNSEGGDALLGNMLGNVYLLENAYRVDLTEELMTQATPEMKQAFVDDINAKAKATGQKKTDYTVQDLDNDVDGIRRTYASSAVYEMMLEKMYGVENTTETAEEAQEGAEKVAGEEVGGEVETGAPEDIWLPLDDYEAVGGYGINNEREAALLQAAKRQGVPAASVPSMLNIFRQDELSPEDFAEGWQQGVGVFGRYNVTDIPEKSALGRMKSYNRDAAFQIGRALASEEAMRREKKAEKKKAPAKSRGVDVEKVRVTGTGAERGQSLEEIVSTPKTEGRVIREKGVYIRDAGEGAYVVYKASELMAKVLGTDIHIHKTLGNRDGGKINGYFDVSDNTIHIALDAGKDARGTALFTLAHEVTHYIREWSPAKFEAISDFVGERMGADMEGLMTRKAELLRKMPEFKDKTVTELNDAAHEEVIADAMETILSDGTVKEDLATYDKSIWEKIKDFIVDLIKKIKKAYGELSPNSQAAKVLKETVDDMSEIQRLWAEGVREAGERTRKAGVETEASAMGEKRFSYIGETKDGRPCYVSGFGESVSMDERIKAFKDRIATIFNLGAVELKTDVKKIRIMGDRFTAQKNLYGDQRVEGEEYKAKISSLYDLADILATSTYDPTATNTEDSYVNPAIKPKNKAHENVKYWYKFRNEIVFDGVPYTVTFNIRDKGKEQYQYLIEFKENKTPGLSNTAVKGLLRTDRMSYDDSITQPEDSVNRKFSISKENSSDTAEPFKAAEARMEAEAAARAEAKTKAETETEGDEIPDVYEIEDETPLEAAARRMREREAEESGDVWTLEDEDRRRQAIRDHELLADALMETAQSESEYRTVKKYKEKVEVIADAESRITELRKKTAELNREMDSLREKIKGVDKSRREVWVMTALDDATAQKDAYLKEMDELSEMIRKEEAKLLSLAAAKPLQKAIREANKRADAMARVAEKERQRAEEDRERSREREAKTRQKAEESKQKYKEKVDEQTKQSRERKEITVRMRAAQKILGSLNRLLYSPTKEKHVPSQLHDLTETVLRSADPKAFGRNRDNIRTMAELADKIDKLERKVAKTAEEQESLDKMKSKYGHLEEETISTKRQAEALLTAFEEYQKNTTDEATFDQALIDALREEVKTIEEAPLTEMTLKSLQAVEEFYTKLKHQVDFANKTFATERALNIDELGTTANREVVEQKALKFLSPKSMEMKGKAGVREYFWKNMKPLTAFEAIGSKQFSELFQNVLNGEEVWITDIMEAYEFLKKAKKEYGFDKWDLQARTEIKTADGKTVSLTLGEKLSLYAYMFRDQAEAHLREGGFTFAPNATAVQAFKEGKIKYEAVLNDQEQHKMRKEDIAEMSKSLTQEQKDFAEAVQKYLTSLGKKGNQVSQKLYGVDLFNETAYFPIRSNKDYLKASTGKSGDPNIKNRGSFKETVPDASNPIVLQDFMSVTTEHINSMASYHAFVLPLEDLTRVWNYTPANIKRDEDGKPILDQNGFPIAEDSDKKKYNSLKAEITKKYGQEANDYILQLIRDLNGGARRDAAATILDKGITAFKRASTMASLSVVIQQPTSLFRAMAYLKGKYFTGAQMFDWETVKKYAPVAGIKEMGGFDTGTGARTSEFLNAREYDNFGQRLRAMLKPKIYGGDPQARAEAFGWLAGKADEVTWRYMFGACVNEQAELLKKDRNSEEVLKAAGKRFTEIVRRTQVYDSTLTRSEYMRSKDGLMKMATAFGSEPTTVVSMVADGIIRAERGDKAFLARTAGGVAASILANALLVSLIYAIRDDDEEKTFSEKYMSTLVTESLEGINPLEYLPIARDVMSIMKGYDVERSDMALIGQLVQSVENITSSKKSVPDKMMEVSGAVSSFFGVPLKNIYRDARGITTTVGDFFSDSAEKNTGTGMEFAIINKLFGVDNSNGYQMYKAILSGDEAHYKRVAARFSTPEAAESALRIAMREHDERIYEAAEKRNAGDLEGYEAMVDKLASEGKFDRNLIIQAIRNESYELKKIAEKQAGMNLAPEADPENDEADAAEGLYVTSDMTSAMERGDTGDVAAIIEQMVRDKVDSGKTEKEAKASLRSASTAYWKKRYIAAWEKNDAAEMRRIRDALEASGLYGGYNDMIAAVRSWIQNAK